MQHVLAFQQAGNRALADREGTENQRPVRDRLVAGHADAALERAGGENPYSVHSEVQETMSNMVGIIRREDEIKTALAELEKLGERAATVSAEGGTAYNPGWHLALDLRNIMLIAESVARAALRSPAMAWR